MPGDELVRATEEDLGGQVPAQLAAEGAFDRDRLEGELIPARGHIAAAPFAGDHEVPTLDGWEAECHFLSIGEVKAKQSTGWGSVSAGTPRWPRAAEGEVRLGRAHQAVSAQNSYEIMC